MRMLALLLSGGLAGCAAFPESPDNAKFDIRNIVRSIECELAAAARSDAGLAVHFQKWSALTDLDLTLERNFAADGTIAVGAPVAPGALTFTPKIAGSNTDQRINSMKFATSIKNAVSNYAPTCFGDNPSQTNMGLANWIVGSLISIPTSEVVTISFTKQFKIQISGGVRFGYVLLPVTNSIDSGAGFSTDRDYTNRFSIALAPPVVEKPEKPLKVAVTNLPLLVREVGPRTPARPDPELGKGEGAGKGSMTFQQLDRGDRQTVDLPPPPRRGSRRLKRLDPNAPIVPRLDTQARERALSNPLLQLELQRKSPFFPVR